MMSSPVADEHIRKGAALRDYHELLRGAELPPALVNLATAADLETAKAALLSFVKADDPKLWPSFAARIRDGWSRAQSSRQRLLDDYGIPFLQAEIQRRFEREAEAEEAARRDRGLTISLHLEGVVIDRFVAQGLVDPAGRDDPERLARAALTALGHWVNRAPEPMRVESPAEFAALQARSYDRGRRLTEVTLTRPGHDPRLLNRAAR
jgi:hypothetical protein